MLESECQALAPARPAKLRILLAEDEAIIAVDLEMLLTEAGHTVVGPVATVADAMRAVASERPDMALLDLATRGVITKAEAQSRSMNPNLFANAV